MLQKFVKYGVFCCKNFKRALCASTEGYLAVAASTPGRSYTIQSKVHNTVMHCSVCISQQCIAYI